MKKLYLVYCIVSVFASFVAGLIIGMVAMRDFMAEEFIVIDPAKLEQYQQMQHNKRQGLTA